MVRFFDQSGMIDRPLIIIGAPRSGTSILRRCLALHPDVWHLQAESHSILEGPLHPIDEGFGSNRCLAEDVTEDTVSSLRESFYRASINLNEVLQDPSQLFATSSLYGRAISKVAVTILGKLSKLRKPRSIRFLEKTPKNTLRVSLMNRIFPDALFIWNRRQPEQNIDSLIAGWHAVDQVGLIKLSRFARAGYPITEQLNLQDYSDKWWKFALVPDWRSLEGCTIGEVAAWQYYQCNRFAIEDLSRLNRERIFAVPHETFIRQPLDTIRDILAWADLPMHPIVRQFVQAFPRVNTASEQQRDKKTGLRYPNQVQRGIEMISDMSEMRQQLGYDPLEDEETVQ